MGRTTVDLGEIEDLVENAYSDSLWQELSLPQKIKFLLKQHLGLVDPSEARPLPLRPYERYVQGFVKGWDMHKLNSISQIPIERLEEFATGKFSEPLTADEATSLINAGMDAEKLKPYFPMVKP